MFDVLNSLASLGLSGKYVNLRTAMLELPIYLALQHLGHSDRSS